MGIDKAFLEVGGRWLIAYALDALAGASQRLIVGGADPRLETAAVTADAVHVADRWPGEGPMGAVATALSEADYPIAVILPCDLPGISPDDVAALVQAAGSVLPGEIPAAAVFADQRRHYLPLAIDTRAAPLVQRLFESGQRAVACLVDELSIVDVPALPTAVTDIDSPEDLRQAGRPVPPGIAH